MEKNMLNEIARMRKMMGLNENLNEYVDSVKIIDDRFSRMESIIKGLAVSASARYDVFQENPAKVREFVDAFNELVKDFVESDEKYDNSNIPTEPEEKKKYVISQIDQRIHGFIYNRGSGSFIRAYSDPYRTEVIKALEKLTKELGLTYSNERLNKSLRLNTESTNGEMGYNPSPLGEVDGSDSVGIITSNGKLMAGYFQEFGLVSAGDTILFDNEGKLVKKGGGYPSSGFRRHEDPKELEKDICNNYEDILDIFRQSAPKVVHLNEGYNIIKKAVECDLAY
jgi:hypothetical protein